MAAERGRVWTTVVLRGRAGGGVVIPVGREWLSIRAGVLTPPQAISRSVKAESNGRIRVGGRRRLKQNKKTHHSVDQ